MNGAKALSNALTSENCKLEYLNLSGNSIQSEGISDLFKSLINNSRLKTLDIGRIKFSPDGVKIISSFLKRNQPTLTRLLMNGNKIGDLGGEIIFEALKENRTITELGLSSNRISGGKCIMEAIQTNETLTILWLSGIYK